LSHKKLGVTLLELTIVVVIVAILATLAILRFQKAMELARVREAIESLRQIREAEQIYYYEHNTYWRVGYGTSDPNVINSTLGTFLDTRQINWFYVVVGLSRTTFLGRAVSQHRPGPKNFIDIDQTGALEFDDWDGPQP
jgi:prepilin-type N-terminal cleavage/methylation domain-containing protein